MRKTNKFIKKQIRKAKLNIYKRCKNTKIEDEKPLEVIDLNDINFVKPDNSNLTLEQAEDLGNIINKVDVKAYEIIKLLKKLNIKNIFIKLKYSNRKIKEALILSVLAIILTVTAATGEDRTLRKEEQRSIVNSANTVVSIDMNNETNKLDYEVESMAIKSSNNRVTSISNIEWIKSDIDTSLTEYSIDNKKYSLGKELKLKQFVIKENYSNLVYTNKEETASKEMIFSLEVPEALNIDTVQKISTRFFEKSNPIQIKSYANTFNNNFLLVSETLGGGELNITSLKDILYSIEDTMLNADTTSGIVLKIQGLPELNISELSELDNKEMIVYSSQDDILRIINSETNSDIVYIFNIESKTLGYNAGDFIETSIENVFIHRSFENNQDTGYKTLAIIADDNIYGFKILGENKDKTLNELMNQLGFNIDNMEIKKVQSVIKENNNGNIE